MTRTIHRWATALALAATALCQAPAQAVQIGTQVQSLGGHDWQIEFTLTNDDLAAGISEFTVWFDHAVYTGLSLTASPTGWDSLVVQPDAALPADGYLDSLALAAPLALGAVQRGFLVQVSTQGLAVPTDALRYEIIDPATFATVASGSTVPAIPEPSAAALALTGLAFIGALAVRRQRCAHAAAAQGGQR